MTSDDTSTAKAEPEKISGVLYRRAFDTFETFTLAKNPGMTAALEQCKKVVRGEAWCALLAGTKGNGKSHLAIGAMNAYGMQRSYFWKVPAYLQFLKDNAFGPDAKYSISDLTRGYKTGSALIVFDDLGTENRTEWSYEQLYSVLDARYDAELPTIITTNLALKEIDDRIKSRYASGLVACNGKDLRLG